MLHIGSTLLSSFSIQALIVLSPGILFFSFFLWTIWKDKNLNLFNIKSLPPSFTQAYVEATEFAHLTDQTALPTRISISIAWTPPPRGTYKLNTDGSCLDNPGNGGVWDMIRNSNGDWGLGFAQYFSYATNNLMELLALIQGLQLVLQHRLLPIHVNIDFEEIIEMLQQGNLVYNPPLHECRLLLGKLGPTIIQHCYREENLVADALAKHRATKEQLSLCNIFVSPPFCSPKCMGGCSWYY